MKTIYTLFLMIFIQISVFSQQKNELQFLKISEDNDFFNLRGEGTDRGYSSGFKLELYYTKNMKTKFPANLLMKMSGDAENLYGWGLSQNLYTPIDIGAKQIQYKDRPYAATMMLSRMLISSDNIKKQRITTSLSVGALGKYAFGDETQTWVHGAINAQKPEGWDNQITNDFLINYLVNYEKLIFSSSENLEIIGNISGNAGTVSNNAGLGVQFRAGLFNNYFSNHEKVVNKSSVKVESNKRKFRAFFYMKTDAVAVMDNSLLQGGFFSHNSSPYKISKDDISRVFMQYEYGFVVSKNRFGIAFFEKLRTPEFKDSYTEQTGNVTFYIGL
jgi:lipid A 3-O-deacylase